MALPPLSPDQLIKPRRFDLRISLIFAALFGFGGVAGVGMEAAKILFFVFLVLFVVSLVMGSRGTRDLT